MCGIIFLEDIGYWNIFLKGCVFFENWKLDLFGDRE